MPRAEAPGGAEPALSPCGREARRADRDRYLSALFAPDARREALFALYAFHAEIAKTREVVSEPLLGGIRLQWWRDALIGPEPASAGHPVLAALRAAALPVPALLALIDAREADLEGEGPLDLAALESYAEATSSALMVVALDVLGEATPAARAAAVPAGIGYALSGLLRATGPLASRHRLMIPADALATAGARAQDVLDGKGSGALARAVRLVAERAAQRLDEAARLARGLPVGAWPALLPAALARADLRLLARRGWNPFDGRVVAGAGLRPARMAWARLVRRI